MSLPTPSTLAELLGLSTHDGVRKTTGEDVEKAYEILDQVQASELREKSLFWAHFDAIHLPSLVSSLLQSTINFRRKSRNKFLLLVKVMEEAMSGEQDYTHISSRFVRLRPSETLELYKFHLKSISLSTFRDSELDAVRPSLMCCIYIIEAIAVHLHPPVLSLPLPDPPARAALKALLPRLLELSDQENGIYSYMHSNLRSLLDASDDLCGLKSFELDKPHVGCWLKCEATRTKGSQPPSPCVRSQENQKEGMLQCGRCLAVRYCSPEHQKIDWKRHKPFCVESSW